MLSRGAEGAPRDAPAAPPEELASPAFTGLANGLVADGKEDKDDLEKLTDQITDELFGIDRDNMTPNVCHAGFFATQTPTLLTPMGTTPTPARGPFGATPLSATPGTSKGTSGGPFSTESDPLSTEQSGLQELATAETSEAAGQPCSSTSEEIGELQTWTSTFNDVVPQLDPDIQSSLSVEQNGDLNCDEKDLLYVFWKFIATETPELEEGVTILVHDIPYGFKLKPDITEMIDSIASIDSVGYIYLPMAVDRPKVNQFRNKGYCFIHFSDANIAQKFITEISDYNVSERPSVDDSANNAQNEQEEPKKMYAVFAKYQGLSTNLHNLLDIESKKWRPKNGFACVRTSSGLSNISLLGLRILAKRHATSVTTHGNRPLPGNVSEDDDDDDVDDHNDLSNEKVTRA
jgi:RNA recognition motif-containing protein